MKKESQTIEHDINQKENKFAFFKTRNFSDPVNKEKNLQCLNKRQLKINKKEEFMT